MTRARFHRTRTRWINRAHSPAALAAVCVLTITSPKSLRRSSEAKALSKIAAARDRESVRFGVVMDDKVLTIDMPWATIRETSTAGISEYILRQMQEARDAVN